MTRSARPDKDGERGPLGCSAQSSARTAAKASADADPAAEGHTARRDTPPYAGRRGDGSFQGWRGSSGILATLAAATHQAPGSVHGAGAAGSLVSLSGWRACAWPRSVV